MQPGSLVQEPLANNVRVRRTWFGHNSNKKIDEVYDFKPQKNVLGQGTYTNIVKGTTKEGNQARAIKIIPKNKIKNREHFMAEVDKLRALDHPNIVKIYEVFEDLRHIYLVMELCQGGDLFEHIVEKGSFTESEAREVFQQIIRALNYCHSMGMCHKDLKPENFLFLTNKPDSPVKVIDFGLAKVFSEGDKGKSKVSMETRIGPPYYVSPEVLVGKYDEASDIWSAGVVLYMTLCGYPPFSANTDAQILDSIQKGIYDFNGPEWKDVSDLAKDLIRKMLCKLDKRLKAEEILKHPWFKEEGDKKHEKPLKLNYQMLKNFKNAQKLKKIALTCIASQLSEGELSELPKLFRALDLNGDGVLTFDELKAGLGEFNEKSAQELREVMDSIDTDKSGTINYTEFLASTIEKNLYLKEEKLYQAFKMFDSEGNGKISAQELMDILGQDEEFKPKLDYYQQLIKEFDKNGDGEIDYSEFIEMMSSASKEA